MKYREVLSNEEQDGSITISLLQHYGLTRPIDLLFEFRPMPADKAAILIEQIKDAEPLIAHTHVPYDR